MIKCIMFDMGDTVINNKNFHFQIDRLYEILPLDDEKTKEDYFKEYNEIVIERLKKRTTDEVRYIDLLKEVNQRFGFNCDEEYLYYLEKEVFYSICEYELHSGIVNLLKDLKENNIRMIVLSNTCFSHDIICDCFKKLDIFNYFEKIFVSSDYGFRKPDSRFFQEALFYLGCKRNEVIMVGNSVDFDIKPAIALRIKALRVIDNYKDVDDKVLKSSLFLGEINNFDEVASIKGFYSLILKKKISSGAIDCINVLKNNGYDAYVVGGAVRNGIIDLPIHDYDITTNALPEDVIRIFEELDYNVILTGIKHGTVMVIKNHNPYEITTFRSDGIYLDNRHPDSVKFNVTLEEDLNRRDFTINSLCFDGEKIIDAFNGMRDLNNGIIRAVGNPQKRFEEDALRILRALRFASYLGFSIEAETKNAIFSCYKLLNNIAYERINDEVMKMFKYDCKDIIINYSDVFSFCYDYDLNKVLIDNKDRIDLLKKSKVSKFTNIMKFALFGPKIEACWRKLRLSHELSKEVMIYQSLNNDIDYNDEDFVIDLCKYKRKQMYYNLIYLSHVYNWNKDKEKRIFGLFDKYKDKPINVRELDVDGNEIRSFGYKKKQIKECEEEILARILRGEFNNKKEEIFDFLSKARLVFKEE